MAAPENKKKKCLTIIPAHWPKFTGPAYKDGMSVSEAKTLWFNFLRQHREVGPTPKVYRSDKNR